MGPITVLKEGQTHGDDGHVKTEPGTPRMVVMPGLRQAWNRFSPGAFTELKIKT